MPHLDCWGSEFCLSRDKVSSPPRLALPVVDEEVLPEGGKGGVDRGPSSADCLKEPLVEDLLRWPRKVGSAEMGDVPPEEANVLESLLAKSPRA